jgi:hypothetical protein
MTKTVQLFVDCMIPEGHKVAPENSHKVVNLVAQNLKTMNSVLVINIVPIRTFNDKKVLVNNGVTKLPSLLDNNNTVVGLDAIKAYINKHINGIRKRAQKDDTDMLREEQMAEMDMDKYEAGEYDDEEDGDEDLFGKGDKDAKNQNIQQKIAQFNSRRKGRIEETKPTKRGSKKKKPTKHRQVQDDDEPDNIEVPQRGGNGGADLKMEDWDPETQQLLDKAGN